MRKNRSSVTREVKKLNTKDLVVDMMYQRDVDMKRIAKMEKDYDPCLVNFVKVSFRDGKYYIFDGRHTVVLEKAVRGNGEDVSVACLVYKGLTRLDEMELFVAQNGENAARVGINDKLRALYNFGDTDVVGMVTASQCAGVRVDFTKWQATNKVTAVSTLMHQYLRMPREQFIDMLSTIKAAWLGVPDSFCREILSGMERFYAAYYGDFKAKDLASSLSKITPIQIVREGKGLGSAALSGSTYARIILRQYNNGRRNKRLEDKL